jgi:hypothetical protein
MSLAQAARQAPFTSGNERRYSTTVQWGHSLNKVSLTSPQEGTLSANHKSHFARRQTLRIIHINVHLNTKIISIKVSYGIHGSASALVNFKEFPTRWITDSLNAK